MITPPQLNDQPLIRLKTKDDKYSTCQSSSENFRSLLKQKKSWNLTLFLFFATLIIPFLESIVRGWIYKSSFYGLYKYILLILIEDLPVILLIESLFLSMLFFRYLVEKYKKHHYILCNFFKISSFFSFLGCSLLNIFFVSDIVTYSILGHRLFLSDIPIYFNQKISFEVLLPSLLTKNTVLAEVLLGVIYFLILLYLFLKRNFKIKGNSIPIFLLPAAGLCLLISSFSYFYPLESPSRQAYANVIFTNQEGRIRFKPYSSDFIEKIAKKSLEKRTLINKAIQDKNKHDINIIQVVFESMAVGQSKLFGNMSQDLFPETDKLVKEKGLWFSNFFQNTYNSASGQFVSMTGHLALPTPQRDYPWHNTSLLKDSLPNRLKEVGYNSEYIASVELDSSLLRKMASLAGFQNIFDLNQTHPADKYAHDDKDLYEFVIKRIKHANKPFYFFVVNSTTHPPYVVPPEFKEWNYEKSFRYADKALADFIRNLENVGFFKNGILIVSSDHHPWEPVTAEEKSKIPYLPEAKVPCFIIGKGIKPRESKKLHSTVDIVPSIEWFVRGKADFYETQSNLFEGESQQIFHHNGNDRNKVYVLCSNGLEEILLNGDDTKIKKDENLCPKNSVQIVNLYRAKFP